MDYTGQGPLSIGFPRQEYCSVLPFPSPGNHPNPGFKPKALMSPELAGRLTIVPPGKPIPSSVCIICKFFDDGHSDQYEVISHCNCDLHFSNN